LICGRFSFVTFVFEMVFPLKTVEPKNKKFLTNPGTKIMIEAYKLKETVVLFTKLLDERLRTIPRFMFHQTPH